MIPDLLLAEAELEALTGLKIPRLQVRRLQEQGFTRARLVRGRAVLERAHYEAVCRGEFASAPQQRDTPSGRPQLRPVHKLAA